MTDTHKLPCTQTSKHQALKWATNVVIQTHTHTTAIYVWSLFFHNAWLNCCKATENFIIQSGAERRESRREGEQKTWEMESERSRQAATVAAAGWGEAGQRELGRRWRGGGEKGGDGQETRRERVQLPHRSSSHEAGLQHLCLWGPPQQFREASSFNPKWLFLWHLQPKSLSHTLIHQLGWGSAATAVLAQVRFLL